MTARIHWELLQWTRYKISDEFRVQIRVLLQRIRYAACMRWVTSKNIQQKSWRAHRLANGLKRAVHNSSAGFLEDQLPAEDDETGFPHFCKAKLRLGKANCFKQPTPHLHLLLAEARRRFGWVAHRCPALWIGCNRTRGLEIVAFLQATRSNHLLSFRSQSGEIERSIRSILKTERRLVTRYWCRHVKVEFTTSRFRMLPSNSRDKKPKMRIKSWPP